MSVVTVNEVRAGRGVGTVSGLVRQRVCVSVQRPVVPVPKNSDLQHRAASASGLASVPPMHPSQSRALRGTAPALGRERASLPQFLLSS